MTNFEKWQEYMKDCPAPQSFIDLSFYFMIATALQRRVWMGSNSYEEHPVFPNVYFMLVGDPGLGKGLSIVPAIKLLRSVKKTIVADITEKPTDKSELELLSILEEIKAGNNNANKNEYTNMRFPVGADTTTFESLIKDHAMSVQCQRVSINGAPKMYIHSSMYFTLEELGTLFRKNHENLMNYLLKSYDCNDFRYKLKHGGEDIVRNPSLNILAGTTYDFIQEALVARMVGQGLTSRALFVAEDEPRFYRFEHVSGNEGARKELFTDLSRHLGKLSTAFGHCPLTIEARDYLCNYFEREFPETLLGMDQKMTAYMARKNLHVRKFCMILHFMDNVTPGPITLDTAQKAMAVLAKLEPKILRTFSQRCVNPRAALGLKIIRFLDRPELKQVGVPFAHILAFFFQEYDEKSIQETLNVLCKTKKLKLTLKGNYVIA